MSKKSKFKKGLGYLDQEAKKYPINLNSPK